MIFLQIFSVEATLEYCSLWSIVKALGREPFLSLMNVGVMFHVCTSKTVIMHFDISYLEIAGIAIAIMLLKRRKR